MTILTGPLVHGDSAPLRGCGPESPAFLSPWPALFRSLRLVTSQTPADDDAPEHVILAHAHDYHRRSTGRIRGVVLGALVIELGCASATAPRRFSDARPPSAPDTLGAPDEGMPDPALRKAPDDDEQDWGAGSESRASLTPAQPGWLGVELSSNGAGQAGVAVVDVVRRSPAAAVGLAAGDVILQVNGHAVSEPISLIRRIRGTSPGTSLPLGILRKGQVRLIEVKIESTPNPDELLERRFVGDSAPPLDAITVVSGGTRANWTALRGQLVVLEFWAPWCGVCQLMHQRLNEWQSQWAMHGVQVIGIAALSPVEARAYAARFGMGYAVAADETESTFRSYDVFAVPSVFLVDRRGIIVAASTGYSSSRLARMEKELILRLGQPGAE